MNAMQVVEVGKLANKFYSEKKNNKIC